MVDDEPIVLDHAVSILQKAGFNVLSANSEADVHALCCDETGPIDVALVHVSIGGQNALELRDCLKARFRDAPIVFMSSNTREQLEQDGTFAPPHRYIAIPFTAEELLARVHEALTFTRYGRSAAP